MPNIKCEKVKVVREYGPPCFIGPDEKPRCTYETTEEECGINLVEELTKKDSQLAEILKVAGNTLSVTILSKTDALKKALVDDIVSRRNPNDFRADCLDASDYRLNPCCRNPKSCDRYAAGREVDEKGVNKMLKSLPYAKQEAIQKQAARFMENARALVEKTKVAP